MLRQIQESFSRGVSGRDNSGEDYPTRIDSWPRVFWTKVKRKHPQNEAELADIIRNENYYVLGKRHSYNGVQLVFKSNSIDFGEIDAGEFKAIDVAEDANSVTVGPAVTIEELKRELLKHKRRLANSGNYMAQTVIGALVTGTHGFGPKALMADAILSLTFLDAKGERQTLTRDHPDFDYVALSFGLVAPIISMTLEIVPLSVFAAEELVCTLNDLPDWTEGASYISYAVFPYSDISNPTIALRALRPADMGGRDAEKSADNDFPDASDLQPTPGARGFLIRMLDRLLWLVLHLFWRLDRMIPFGRPWLNRQIAALVRNNPHRKSYETDPEDLDYLYDPEPKLLRERLPNPLKQLFSPTYTAYNLAFFVPQENSREILQFILHQADELRRKPVRFYLKSTIGVRQLADGSSLKFAGNHNGPAAAIDLFADIREYAWLERIQAAVMDYFPGKVRPHWGKSKIVNGFAETLGAKHIERMKEIHKTHFPYKTLMLNKDVSRLFQFSTQAPGTDSNEQEYEKRGLV